jgi:hypothetical protein
MLQLEYPNFVLDQLTKQKGQQLLVVSSVGQVLSETLQTNERNHMRNRYQRAKSALTRSSDLLMLVF